MTNYQKIIIKGNYTYDKLSKVVLLDSFYYRFLLQQKPLPRSHFPHPPSKVLNLSGYVI